MRTKAIVTLGAVVALGAGVLLPVPSFAKGFGDFMNPSKWFGGSRDHDYDYYREPGYGYGGPYGYPGYGGWGGYPGYGYGPYGYPGYGGWGGYPGYAYPRQQSQGSSSSSPPPAPQ